MKNMIFISRHTPTDKQIALADEQGYKIVHVGDCDAFDASEIDAKIGLGYLPHAVCCVHPLIALRARDHGCAVAVFENANRAPEGEKPSFEAVRLVVIPPQPVLDGETRVERIRQYRAFYPRVSLRGSKEAVGE